MNTGHYSLWFVSKEVLHLFSLNGIVISHRMVDLYLCLSPVKPLWDSFDCERKALNYIFVGDKRWIFEHFEGYSIRCEENE